MIVDGLLGFFLDMNSSALASRYSASSTVLASTDTSPIFNRTFRPKRPLIQEAVIRGFGPAGTMGFLTQELTGEFIIPSQSYPQYRSDHLRHYHILFRP
jgi:hypothetical protein